MLNHSLISVLKKYLNDHLYKNSIVIMLTTGVSGFFGFFYWVIAARYYDTNDIGFVAALLSAMGLLALLSSLGIHISLIRFLPSWKDKSALINTLFTIAGMFSILVAILFILGIPVWSPNLSLIRENELFFFLFTIFTVATTLVTLQKYIFIAMRKPEFYLLLETLMAITKVILIMILMTLGLLGIFSSWGIALCLTFVFGVYVIGKLQPNYSFSLMIKKEVIRKIAHFSSASYIAEIAGSGTNYVIPIIIVNILGLTSTAYFYISFKVAMVIFTIPMAVITSLFVEGSHDPEKLRYNVIRSTKIFFLLLIPTLSVVFLYSGEILELFGAEYSQNGVQILRLLALSSVPLYFNELFVAVKRVQDQISSTVYLFSALAFVTILSVYILINKIGLIGAAWGWVLGQSIVASLWISHWFLVKLKREL